MKKKILAVVLAAATAFSMFGASLSASAAALKAYPVVDASVLVAGAIDTTKYSEVDGKTTYAVYDEYIEDMENIADMIVDDDSITPDAKHIYSYNYTAASWNIFETALQTALNAAESDQAYYVGVYTNLANAVLAAATYVAPTDTVAESGLKFESGNAYTVSDLRKGLLTDFAAAKTAVGAMSKSDYYFDGLTTVSEADYDMIVAWFAESYTNKTNSWLVYVLAEYEYFLDNAEYADADSALTLLEKAIDEANAIIEYRSEYKTTTAAVNAFDRLQAALDAAEAVLYDGSATNTKIATATSTLNARIASVKNYAIAATTAEKAALKAAIDKAEACKADAGYVTTGTTTAVKNFNTAYDKAVAVYAATNPSHAVVTATEDLLNAIDGLTVTAARASHVLAKTEDLTTLGAFAAVESDYTAASWAKFETAMNSFDAAVTTAEVDAAYDKVVAAYGTLVKVSTRTARTAFAAALKSALALQADKTVAATKSVAATNAYNAAVKTATDFDTKYGSTGTVSMYEAQTKALQAAMDAYKKNKVVEAFNGWAYETGTWYFYKDGEKAKGWIWDADYSAYFYLKADGSMAKGWMWDASYNSWYYLKSNGKMASNEWIYDTTYKAWYYMYANGKMATNTTIGGYKVDASGKWVA